MDESNYIITGGEEGKKRLSILSDVLHDTTLALLEKNGSIAGKKILDLGCGGGHVAIAAAQLVGASGHVTAIDFDAGIVALAAEDARSMGITNVSFEVQSAYELTFQHTFDMVYSRFLLSHLQHPKQVLQKMKAAVKPGGTVMVEDVQFSGHFCYPPNPAFEKYVAYYTAAANHHQQNPEIGPALFKLFTDAGFSDIGLDAIQPCFHKGPGKWMGYITMDKIKDKVIAQGLADAAAIDTLLKELEAFTADESTIISLPRIFRVWGKV